jgi:hypothetical protein
MKRSALKSAKVTFSNFKIDLDQTWAIPMGETMARIAPIQAQDDIFIQRNQLTARLYGIGKDCSAIRIMSAIKNTGAKTVHIPLNSRTGKRRRFAIIGFKDNDSLSKAITKHIFLFSCETWWSTKDNTKTLEKQNYKGKGKKYYLESHQETYQRNNESEEETWSNSEDEEEPLNYNSEMNKKQTKYTNDARRKEDHKRQYKKEHKTYNKSYRVANKKETETPQVLQQILDQLSQFNNRLAKVEKTNLTNKARGRSNRS